MDMSDLRPLYGRPGPFSSAYVDISHDTADAEQELRLRAKDAGDRLREAGAPEEDAEAVRDAVRARPPVPGRAGLAVIAAGGEVLHEEVLPDPPAEPSHVRFSTLPHVMPMLVARGERVPHVVVVADRLGADLAAFADRPGTAGRADPQDEEQLTGSDWPLTKVRAGGYAQARYQRSAENTWDENADAVAAEVADLAERYGAELLLVAGDQRAVGMLEHRLPERWRAVLRRIDGGERLEEQRRTAVAEHAAARRRGVEERFAAGETPTVEGFGPTVNVLPDGSVDTLLMVDHPDTDAELWIGPDPAQVALFGEDVRLMGVDVPERERADDAIARALAATAGQLLVVGTHDGGPTPREGIGALLRHG